jgi:hypothetical protein
MLKNVVGVDVGLSASELDCVGFAVVDSKEGNSEETCNDGDDLEGALGIVSLSPVSVLPDDVGGLGRLLKAEFVVHEFLVRGLLASEEVKLSLVLLGNEITVFSLEGDEGVDWLREGIEFFILELVDLTLNLAHLIVALEDDMATSESEKVDQACIIEGEGDVSNLNLIDLKVIIFLLFL